MTPADRPAVAPRPWMTWPRRCGQAHDQAAQSLPSRTLARIRPLAVVMSLLAFAIAALVLAITPLAVSSTGAMTAGSIKVAGANSALQLTVTSSDTFSLQVDTNGDGTYDSTSTVTRSQLASQL